MKQIRAIIALILAVILILPQTAIPAEAKTKTASIDKDYKVVDLQYNDHGISQNMLFAYTGLESRIKNANKKATYSAVIKNKKVAKTVKNKINDYDDPTYIVATGIGTTTATVYEKLGKKKTKVGTLKIRVKAATLSDVADAYLWSGGRAITDVTLNMHLREDMKTYDFATKLHESLNDKATGLHINKSEYEATFSMPYADDPEFDAAIIDENGVLSAVKAGNAFLEYTLKFVDGSETTGTTSILVVDSVIKKENKYSLENIRNYIVGLNEPVELEDGTKQAMINFDNAATTPAFKPVQDEVNDKMDMYGSIGRGFSQKSNYSTDIYNSTRDKVLEFVGANQDKYTCFYVNNTTDGLNKLASALIESKDDLVLTTRIEHHANDLSWRERCKVIYAEVDDDGRIIYSDIEKLLKKNKGKVKYVSVTAASNVTGYVTDVHKVAKIAHKYGAKIIVDGAQIVAHRKFSMLGATDDENIDFFVFSAHKMYSPYGGGAVVGLSEVLNQHMPTFYGGGTISIVADDWQLYKSAPERYEAGSPNYPGVVGLGKAIEVLSDVGFDSIQAHEKELNRRLVDGLKQLDNVIVYGDTVNMDDKVGVVTFNFTDINTQLLAEQLSKLGGVATRRGAFCAHPYVWRLMNIPDSMLDSFEGCGAAKTPGMVRVSFGIYNTTAEVDKFLQILPKAMEAAKAQQEFYDVVPEY